MDVHKDLSHTIRSTEVNEGPFNDFGDSHFIRRPTEEVLGGCLSIRKSGELHDGVFLVFHEKQNHVWACFPSALSLDLFFVFS